MRTFGTSRPMAERARANDPVDLRSTIANKPLQELLPIPGIAEPRVVERRFEASLTKIGLQRLPNFEGWDKHDQLSPRPAFEDGRAARRPVHVRPLLRSIEGAQRRAIDPADEYLCVRDSKRRQDALLHVLPGRRRERQNRRRA